MNQRERFLAVAKFQKPDYVPIFGFQGAPGMSCGCMQLTYDQLRATGMPDVGGNSYGWQSHNLAGWQRYWGTTSPIGLDFSPAWGAEGFKSAMRIEGEFEVIESENGEITRQVLHNDITYSMPEFVRYPVRDRASWEFYKAHTEPRQFMPRAELERNCRRYDQRDRPLVVGAGSTFGHVRSLMGTEAASLALYDDPDLVHDIIGTGRRRFREHTRPLIEILRPEIVIAWEDIGYKTSQLISPVQFREFCAPFYREVADVARAAGVPVLTVDSDGCAMELAPLLVECGFNSLHPFEAKSNNDLFALRRRFPQLVMFGWLEKEIINAGNERLIAPEITGKVPPLLARGGYFPNGDHGIQPMATFPNLCRFMTLLHEVCGNPEGEFPRTK